MNEIAEAFRTVFERIAAFFDIFDLSFVVSGAATLAAALFWRYSVGLPLPAMTGWPQAISFVLICYLIGLICFAIGRWLRIGLRRKTSQRNFDQRFIEILKAHGLDEDREVQLYLQRKQVQSIWRLYIRLWAEFRQRTSFSPSLTFLNRYWVMAATYDGLAIALFVWCVVILALWWGVGTSQVFPSLVAFPIIVGLSICAIACSREAGRFVEYQIEELVAAIAAQRAIEFQADITKSDTKS